MNRPNVVETVGGALAGHHATRDGDIAANPDAAGGRPDAGRAK